MARKRVKKKRVTLTQERVRELFNYNQETGLLTRRLPVIGGKEKVGTNSHGYISLMIDGYLYQAHRVIWLWMEGYMPEQQVDHISRIRDDNRWCNLRLVSRECNIRNSPVRVDNTSSVRGVQWMANQGRWNSSIFKDGKRRFLKSSKDFTEAVAYRLAAESCLGWPSCDSCSSAFLYMQEYLKEVKC